MTSHHIKCRLFKLTSGDVRKALSSSAHLSSLPALSCQNVSLGWHPSQGHNRQLSAFPVDDEINGCRNVSQNDSFKQFRNEQQTITTQFMNRSNVFCRHGLNNVKTQKVNVFTAREFHGLTFNYSHSVNLHKLPPCPSNHLPVREYSSDHKLRYWIMDSQSPVVEYSRDLFLNFHEFTGLPMWASICLFGVIIKVFLLPLTVIRIKNSVKVTYVTASSKKAQAQALEFTAEKAKLHNWTEKKQKMEARRLASEFEKKLYQKHRCSKAVNLVVHTNTALLFLYSLRGLRSLCPQFENLEPHKFVEDIYLQGVLWFSDLTVNDFILPVICWMVVMMDTEMIFAGYHMSGIKLGWREYLPKALCLLLLPVGYIQPCVEDRRVVLLLYNIVHKYLHATGFPLGSCYAVTNIGEISYKPSILGPHLSMNIDKKSMNSKSSWRLFSTHNMCVPLFWASMYSTQLLLSCLIRCPSVFNVIVRPSFLPALPSDATPNRDLLQAVKKRYTFRKKTTDNSQENKNTSLGYQKDSR